MGKAWMVRAGRESTYVDDFLTSNIVAIGWEELGQLFAGISKEEVLQKYIEAYPESSNGKAQNAASQIVRFINEFCIGDRVTTYDRDQRVYYLGEIRSDYKWSPNDLSDMPHARSVHWTRRAARDQLSSSSKNSLGAIQTLFQVGNEILVELEAQAVPLGEPLEKLRDLHSVPLKSNTDAVDEEAEGTLTAFRERAEDLIEEQISHLDWEEMQTLVAGILRAMGYRTTVSPKGADRGVDIFASPDGLGLEEPRIFVEVKHRLNQNMGSQELRSFLGGRSEGDRCLYVSTGGFTKDARYEADRSKIPLRLLGLVDVRKLLVDYYEQMDEEVRSLIPLQRIYIPAD